MRKLFISENTPDKIKSMLISMGFCIVGLPKEPSLPAPVSSHADMLIFSDGEKSVTAKSYYEKNKNIFEGINISLSNSKFHCTYPNDIIFNAFVYRDTIFGRLDAVCSSVKNLYQSQTNLRQGYAKCSTLLFADNAVTSDKHIADSLAKKGCNVLKITPGHISLPGYDYGFIGGASFVYENKVIFFGNIENHPDHKRIKELITSSGFEMIYEKSCPLTDIGGAVLL